MFVENYVKFNTSVNYVNVKIGYGDIDENIKFNGLNEERFLKNIKVILVFVYGYMFKLN